MVVPVIVSEPDVMSETPCFRGTRVPFNSLTVTQEMAVQALEEAKDSLLARMA